MTTVLRILNQFKIVGRGWVYTVKNESFPNSFKIDDIFYDLANNRFKIIGLEMICQRNAGQPASDECGILIEALDTSDIQGTLLINQPALINFLFCSHPLYPKKVDMDYQEELSACSKYFPCGLFSYEDMEQGQLSMHGAMEGLAIYRGWMMKPDMYLAFFCKLKERNIILINTPEEYNKYHMLPGWYENFKDYTAKSVWTKGKDLETALALLKQFSGAVIVKDYVKSRKHEWYDACYIPQAEDTQNAQQIISTFISRQNESLIGGIVIREFLSLNPIGYHDRSGMPISEEYRAFILAGKILAITDYWNKNAAPSFSHEEHRWLTAKAAKIKSNFAAMDFARTTSGNLVIMELGDGQVSGLQQMAAEIFYDCLKFLCLK